MAGIYLFHSKNESFLRFSLFKNNNQESDSEIFHFQPYEARLEFFCSYCNFIQNTRTSGKNGLIYSECSTTFSDSVCIGNFPGPLFQCKFDESYTNVIVNHCYIDQKSDIGRVFYKNDRSTPDTIKLKNENSLLIKYRKEYDYCSMIILNQEPNYYYFTDYILMLHDS